MSQNIRLFISRQRQEMAAVRLAADWLGQAVTDATAGRLSVACHFQEEHDADRPETAHCVDLVSLSSDTDDIETSWPDVERRIRARLSPSLSPSSVLMTVFRATGEPLGVAGLRRERIRRLNLLALDLSRERGCVVADIDRALADVGARVLQTDDRLDSELASRAAAQTIASVLAAGPFDAWLSTKEQEEVISSLTAHRLHEARSERLEVFAAPVITIRVGSRRQRAEVLRRDATQVSGYVRQVLSGRISILEAVRIVHEAIARRGLRHCLKIVLRGLTRSNDRNAPRPA